MDGTVLYVEDNEDNIRLIERILRRRSVHLIVARTGRHGLQLAAAEQPDLILLDRRLPDLPGDDVLRQLKAEAVTTAIPVVVLSGDSADEHTAPLLRLGAAGYIGKPFELSAILATVDRFCPASTPTT
jgi:DNA-binding response OmpR family regulator